MLKPTLISVAMCTYNGEKYLQEQLESIEKQTTLPTEIVISDDGSNDKTIQIIEQFALTSSISIRIHKNPQSLGVTKNFEKALSLCQYNYILLSDQDDVWLPQKVEKMVDYLTKNPTIELLFSNATIVNKHLVPLGFTQFEMVRLNKQQKKNWHSGKITAVMLGQNRVTGCTVAIRKSLLKYAIPFPTDQSKIIHDNWLAWIATLNNSIAFIDNELTLYRQHEAQQIGTKTADASPVIKLIDRLKKNKNKQVIILEDYHYYFHLYQKLLLRLPSQSNLDFEKKISYLQMRSNLSDNVFNRFYPIFKHIVNSNYCRFKDQDLNTWAALKTILGDIFMR